MQSIRSLTLALATMLVASCTSFTGPDSPTLPRDARWGLVPLVNYSQTPQAGERSEQILLSALSAKGLRPRVYPFVQQGDMVLMDDRERLASAMDWARQEELEYVISGSVEEWQYKNGLDGEPAVGISLRILDPASGQVLWSNSGARAGWSRESLAGTAQQVLDQLVDELRLD
ncbi:MAG TPA: penicillin-binding protein activator LpoB [Pseudomonas xinjiangensis]|uniref:Penicillin-binding protein activator LpoB n=2 Tax=root TaxID=1 RepID=A0A7V1BQ90_9GAMM|nr:penicillin-binding protein activator LpoB [Halopseudomonas xinjiangensis]HEC48801.1 penicillin-binding protein activator LpoB [Halopseudomonas xinjiangensis]